MRINVNKLHTGKEWSPVVQAVGSLFWSGRQADKSLAVYNFFKIRQLQF